MYPKKRAGPGIATLALAVALWLATPVMAASANGGANEVFRAKQGPYEIYEIVVGIIPPTPQVGILHFTVSVVERATSRPVASASVTIEARGPQGSSGSTEDATNTFGAPNYYDANIAVDKPGEWEFEVVVDSPLGNERVTFPLRVQQTTVNWGAIAATLAAIVLALPIVVASYRSLRGRGRAHSKGKKT